MNCPAGCCPHDSNGRASPGCPADLPDAPLAERAAHLYACQGLSTYRIAALTGISRQRVGRLLARSGVAVKPRGAGRPRSADPATQALDEMMEHLYLRRRLSSTQIAALTGLAARTVRQRLRARGVPMRTRGRCNREDRTEIAPQILAELYVRSSLTADEIGTMLGVSRRVVLRAAHDAGLPVRVGGPSPSNGPEDIELIRALYADPAIRRALGRYNVPVVPAPGPIWQRFPMPVPLSAGLATELYQDCGIGLHHIELLTGQPAGTIRKLLRAKRVTLRPAGGRTPFLRRWRAGELADTMAAGPSIRRASRQQPVPVTATAACRPAGRRPGRTARRMGRRTPLPRPGRPGPLPHHPRTRHFGGDSRQRPPGAQRLTTTKDHALTAKHTPRDLTECDHCCDQDGMRRATHSATWRDSFAASAEARCDIR